MCSFGDYVALSGRSCDAVTAAKLIAREVSDGVIAPGYDPEALAILKTKRKGSYNIVQIDPDYVPEEQEREAGVRRDLRAGPEQLQESTGDLAEQCGHRTGRTCRESAARDLIVALITLKYTQSNSVCYAYDGQAIGVGAGQQSRIHCTRLAGGKADTWFLRQYHQGAGPALPGRTWPGPCGTTWWTAIINQQRGRRLRRRQLAEVLSLPAPRAFDGGREAGVI